VASLAPHLAIKMNKASIHSEWDRHRSACDAIAHLGGRAYGGVRVQRSICIEPVGVTAFVANWPGKTVPQHAT